MSKEQEFRRSFASYGNLAEAISKVRENLGYQELIAAWQQAAIAHFKNYSLYFGQVQTGDINTRQYDAILLTNQHFGGGHLFIPLELRSSIGRYIPGIQLRDLIANNTSDMRSGNVDIYQERKGLDRLGLRILYLESWYEVSCKLNQFTLADAEIWGVDIERWLYLDKNDLADVNNFNTRNDIHAHRQPLRAMSAISLADAVEETMRSWWVFPVASQATTWRP